MKNNILGKLSVLLIFPLSFLLVNKIQANSLNNNVRVVALTSLTADLINTISKDSLVGIPGSSILKKNKEFDSIPIVSSGRMPPDLEKILSLKPNLVIGAKGFHDRPLSKLNSLGISTLSTSISSLDDLDKLNNLASEITNKTEFKGYVNLSPEWLIKSQPENILIIKTPGSDMSQYESINIWNKLEAVKNNKIYTFDYYGLINAGGIKAINKACQKLSSI